MTTTVPIKSALKMLTLLRSQRSTPEERERIDHVVCALSRAQVDLSYFHWLHLPKRTRGEYLPPNKTPSWSDK